MKSLIEVTLPVPVDEAWAHLRDPALIRRWFGWEYDGLAHEIDVIFLQEAAVDEPAHTLRWDDGMQQGDRIELEPDGDGTVLRVVRAEGGDDEIAEGWISFVQQLRFALEHHRGEDRRTLRLSGGASADVLPGAAAGDRYELTAGAAVSGEVFYRTPRQLGLTVDQLGPGLLLIAGGSLTLTSYGDAPPDEAAWRAWWTGAA